MRPWPLLPVAVLLLLPAGAGAQAGGTAAPDPSDRAGGGIEYGKPVRKARTRRTTPLTATEFSAAPASLQPGAAARFTYRVDGGDGARRVRVRIDVVRVADGQLARRIRLGWKPTRVRRTARWKVGELPAGDYEARLHASDGLGHTLRRTARASGRSTLSVAAPVAPVTIGSGAFPVGGPFSFGGDDARFGADRGDHVHEGQDLMAPEGTPVLSPRAGFVRFKAYQSGGAGHYLVVHGDDNRDYVFMHLVSGSIPVGKDDPVAAGQQIGAVGTTGRAEGAHLHFEIWPGGWYVDGSRPVDPRPELDAWAAAAGLTPS